MCLESSLRPTHVWLRVFWLKGSTIQKIGKDWLNISKFQILLSNFSNKINYYKAILTQSFSATWVWINRFGIANYESFFKCFESKQHFKATFSRTIDSQHAPKYNCSAPAKTWLVKVAVIFIHRTGLLHRTNLRRSFLFENKIEHIFGFYSSFDVLLCTLNMDVEITYFFKLYKIVWTSQDYWRVKEK